MKYIAIILIIFSHIFVMNKAQNNDLGYKRQKKMILFIGPTRAGKSCFINMITGKNLTLVGDDSGDSTTKEYNIYESIVDGFPTREKYKLIDMIGLDDSDESGLADPIILANLLYGLKEEMENTTSILKSIYVFESLTNDANQVQKTIKKLKAVFGEDVGNNIVAVFIKNPRPSKKRMDTLKQKLKDENVNSYIHWLSGCGNFSDDYLNQMIYLYRLTNESKFIKESGINNIYSDLIEEGKSVVKNNKNEIFNKYKKYIEYTAIGLTFANMIGLPMLIFSNIAVYGLEKLYTDVLLDKKFLLSLAIEERMKTHFKKKDDL